MLDCQDLEASAQHPMPFYFASMRYNTDTEQQCHAIVSLPTRQKMKLRVPSKKQRLYSQI
jgi:hypothetical protein